MEVGIFTVLMCLGFSCVILGQAWMFWHLCRTRDPDETIANTKRDVAEELPSLEYKARERDIETEGGASECAVCLESFKEREKCRLLPICEHIFHARCIDKWLLKNPICPICRRSYISQKINEQSHR